MAAENTKTSTRVHKGIIHNSYEWSSDTEVQLKHLTVIYTAMIDIYEVRD